MADHRRDERYRLRIPATILSRSVDDATTTEDVSLRGCFLRTSEESYKLLQLVRVRFDLPPEGTSVTLLGLVANLTPNGVGIEFYGFDGEPKRAWERFLAWVRSGQRAVCTDHV